MTKFRVKTVEALSVLVEADYFRIQDGALIFRNKMIGNHYPEVVHVFAAGVWLAVEPAHDFPQYASMTGAHVHRVLGYVMTGQLLDELRVRTEVHESPNGLNYHVAHDLITKLSDFIMKNTNGGLNYRSRKT